VSQAIRIALIIFGVLLLAVFAALYLFYGAGSGISGSSEVEPTLTTGR
jgi:hypothetical protein